MTFGSQKSNACFVNLTLYGTVWTSVFSVQPASSIFGWWPVSSIPTGCWSYPDVFYRKKKQCGIWSSSLQMRIQKRQIRLLFRLGLLIPVSKSDVLVPTNRWTWNIDHEKKSVHHLSWKKWIIYNDNKNKPQKKTSIQSDIRPSEQEFQLSRHWVWP